MKNIFKILLLIFSLVFLISSFATFAVSAEGTEEDKKLVVASYSNEDEHIILVFEDGREYNSTKQEWVSEENEIKGVDLKFDISNLGTSLTYMWQGMLCIFVVIGAIILSVYLIGFLSEKVEERKKLSDSEETNE